LKNRKSFKFKKKLLNDPAEWKIFKDTHEPIVETAVWERVQEIRKGKRRPVRNGEITLFNLVLAHLQLFLPPRTQSVIFIWK
jgi:hypothetical protein